MKTNAMLALAALGLVVLPQALAAAPPKPAKEAQQAAKTACKAERAAVGVATFRETYGSGAFRACVREQAPAARDEAKNAAQACRAERQADPAAFRGKYGANGNKRNAMGRCVSKAVSKGMRESVRENVEAAKACRVERKEDPELFAEVYGSGPDAFAACVAEYKAGGEGDAGGGEDEEPSEDEPPA